MALNYIWISFFLIAFIMALVKLIVFGDTEIFKTIMDGIFDSAGTGVQISIGLIGIMSLFLGFLNIGEKAGAIRLLSRIIGPFFNKLFPEIPKDHPSYGHMVMNLSATLLGLENAATPFGLKAMQSLQELNPDKERASNAQIMFMVLAASGLTLIPISIIAQRVILKSADPTRIFIPCMMATFSASVVGLLVVAIKQRINLFNRVVLLWAAGIAAVISCCMLYLRLHRMGINDFSKVLSNGIILSLFIAFIAGGLWKKIKVFESFIDGAKAGFEIAVKIIPYLVAMLVAIGVLRNCGVFDYLIRGLNWVFSSIGLNTDFVPALPTALMKPLSGNGSRAMMISTMKQYGPDSFQGLLSCVFQGTSDTTFYIVALYFGSVGIKKTRYAVPASLLADLGGMIAAIAISYFFFHSVAK